MGFLRIFADMNVILSGKQIDAALEGFADDVVENSGLGVDIAVIGIRSRGEVLAQRLSKVLSERIGVAVECGTLDITLYRDDLNDPHGQEQPRVRATEIGFDINDKIIILVDDVLYTGRSIRAALDALIDLGRPKAIRLAVLVDRGHRELPIQADHVGSKVDILRDESIVVNLKEVDGKDQVIVE